MNTIQEIFTNDIIKGLKETYIIDNEIKSKSIKQN